MRTTQVDHGFDRKDVTCLHNTLGLVLVVVRNVGSRMEQAANTVSTIGPDHTAFVGGRDLVNGRTQITIQRARFDQG